MSKLLNANSFTRIVVLLAIGVFLSGMCVYGDCGLSTALEPSVIASAPKVLAIIFMFVLVKLVTSSLKIITKTKPEDSQQKSIGITTYIRYGLWIVFFALSAHIIFGDVGALLTSLGLIGFGVTFALQKPILNLVGWASINAHKSFDVGDRIKIGDIAGDVVEIKAMHTILKSLLTGTDEHSGKLVSIPNELVLVQPVENFTKDNNFLKTELNISITYESDWRKAKKAFESIVNNTTKKNVHMFKSRLTKRISFIDSNIEKLSKRIEISRNKERGEKIKEQIEILEKEKEDIKGTFEEIPDQLKPKIHVEMADSSIVLTTFFMAPYDMLRTTKTMINSEFLDFVKREPTVEIAYPHLQIIPKGKPNQMNNKIISDFLGIENIDLNNKEND
ncbi:MAG: mechanosensitive ion channel domain-containing protein [Candidatus Aenigmatarchaeota archaeon]